ncbi:MAG TPA: PQQ-binding-like beta-propeller repeat protein [Acidimicrobiales bacterium]|nr:PQQ-binding-like beta-propeller repeat protein [Acidimicrobiales bacterium]
MPRYAKEPVLLRRKPVAAILAGIFSSAAILAPGAATGVPGPGAHARPAGLASTPLGNLLTYDYDNGRSGDDAVGPHIASLSSKPAWDDNLDGADYGQPLVYQGTVYVATENDTVYAVAAGSGAVRWSVHVGSPAHLSVVDDAPTLSSGCGDIDPLGITGTPVIDPGKSELFAVEETEAGGSNNWAQIQHWLVAISLKTHRELWHRQIDPPEPNRPGTYYIPAEQQRPAVTLFDGRLYVPFGGLNGDCGQYHGYVTDISESGTGAVGSYQVPTQREGAIWGAGGAMVSAQGDLYVVTGNGSSDNPAQFDEGDSVVELSTSLQRLGVWAPGNWVEDNEQDWDLGSASAVQVPGTSLLFVAGKGDGNDSLGYVMTEGHLGGVGRGAFTGHLCPNSGNPPDVYGANATATLRSGLNAQIFVYAACGSGTEAVLVTPSPPSFHDVWAPSSGSPNGPPIVAGGVVWALDWDNNILYGMNPRTGNVLLTRNTENLDHFATPGAGDGMLLVPTQEGVEAFRAVE